MRRRDFLAIPAIALPLRALPFEGIEVIRLTTADPVAELSRYWSEKQWPEPARILVRAHPAWWPSARQWPDRWQAWLELPGGGAVLAIRQPLPVQPPAGQDCAGPADHWLTGALSAAGSAAA